MPDHLTCPACPFDVEVSTEDPDASLSYMFDHILARHAAYNGDTALRMLADVKLAVR